LDILPILLSANVEINLLDFLATSKDVAKMLQRVLGPFDFQLSKVNHFPNGTADQTSWHPVTVTEI